MPPRNPNAEPKPFVWVPIPSEGPQRREPTTHERFVGLTGVLEFTLTVNSAYLFVGSGAYEFDPNAHGDRPDVWYTFYRRNGQLCIPGTSLKGAIRSIVEAITNSCVSQYKRGEEIPLSHQRCSYRPGKQENLCPACRLFGVAGLRGRVHFADAIPVGRIETEIIKIGELWEPSRQEEQNRKFYQAKRYAELSDKRPQTGYRFVEAVKREASFQCRMYFENVAEAELGLLFFALGCEKDEEKVVIGFTPKIGGAKPRCLGAVVFGKPKVVLRGGSTLKDFLHARSLTGDGAIRFLQQCMQKCQESGLIHKSSWEKFRSEMRDRDEFCPKGMY